MYSTISYATFRDKTVGRQQKVNRTFFARERRHISSIRVVNAHAHTRSIKESATRKDVGHDGCPILSPERRNDESYRLSSMRKLAIVVLKCLKLLEVFDLARLDRQWPKTW